MWVEFEISNKKYYLSCTTNDEDEVDCVLYDGCESWHEKQTLTIILKRAKELNKRIQFDEATIKNTLYEAQPTEANWLEGDGDSGECSLKLKYRVQSCPLNFTWHFNKQTEHDFQQFILFPLFRIVQGLTQQNEELREVVRKKDVEIKQYKTEGAILKRVTVATTPFSFTSFDEKYSDSIALSKRIMQISDLLKAQYKPMQTPVKVMSSAPDDDSKDNNVKLTPRRKRRKILEEQQRIIAEKLKARGKPMEYESSQSQTLSTSSPDPLESERSKKLEISPDKKPDIDSPITAKEQICRTTPSKSLRARKESIQSPIEEVSTSRKRKVKTFINYNDSQSSTEEEEDKTVNPPTNSVAKTGNVIKTETHSSLDVKIEQDSEDIQSIIDDWKALEQRRVADLNNARTTRTGKRISY